MIFLVAMMFVVPDATAQRDRDSFNPLPRRTVETEREALRLMRNDKLDLVLPLAMRRNRVDMWIHVSRGGDPLQPYFGSFSGYLVFTDLGHKIERAIFGGRPGAVEKIDVEGSWHLRRAFGNYNYNNTDPAQGFSIPEVYKEIMDFVAERDPQTVAVNFSDWLREADGISYSSYLKLEKILGPKYSKRIVSADKVIVDFVARRTSREVAAQTEVLALARQRGLEDIAKIVPGVTTIGEIGGRLYYSAGTKPQETEKSFPPSVRWISADPDYVLQRGDFFVGSNIGPDEVGDYMGHDVDTKIHCYILREGETKVPDFIQKVFDKAIAGQWILRDHMKVGMTAKESLDAMVKAMVEAGYHYTPFIDSHEYLLDGTRDGDEDYRMIQKALAGKGTDYAGFSIDNHHFGILESLGPSMGTFRTDSWHLTIQENNLFAFEYMVHMNIDERPGYPLAINISNPQVITSLGVEFIQPPNEEIFLIR
jgi:hypothetical protein